MINSTSNKQVKRVSNLRDKAKARREEGVYVAEGLRMCREYKPDDVEILYITESFGKQEENKKWLRGFKFEIVTDEVMHYMADTKTPQGVLAVAKQKKCTMEDILKKTSTPKLIMILENIQDPGNLGTIIRLADWFGIEHIFCSAGTADVYNPKTVQATMGALARVKVHYCSLPQLIESLTDIPVYGTFLNGNIIYTESLSAHGLIVMGNEGKGVSLEVEKLINNKLYIPNYPQERETSESLNVAIATAVVCSEFRRRLLP